MPAPSIYPLLLAAGHHHGGGRDDDLDARRDHRLHAHYLLRDRDGVRVSRRGRGDPTAIGEATGLDNRKVGIWAFIGSESLFFASLIATYLIYKGRDLSGPTAETILNVPLSTVTTFVLLMSSLLMVLAQDAYRRGDRIWGLRWLLGTIVLGLIFLGGQVYEFTQLLPRGADACRPICSARPSSPWSAFTARTSRSG